MSQSYFKCIRSKELEELMRNKNACMLLLLIAYRARRTTIFSVHNLEMGEALIGDHKVCGLTQQEYRSAKKVLQECQLATFKPTNKGTIAKLTNSDIFDVNIEISNKQTNKPTTNQQQTSNKPATTNKNEKNEKNEKNKEKEKDISLKLKFDVWKNFVNKSFEALLADHDWITRQIKKYDRVDVLETIAEAREYWASFEGYQKKKGSMTANWRSTLQNTFKTNWLRVPKTTTQKTNTSPDKDLKAEYYRHIREKIPFTEENIQSHLPEFRKKYPRYLEFSDKGIMPQVEYDYLQVKAKELGLTFEKWKKHTALDREDKP